MFKRMQGHEPEISDAGAQKGIEDGIEQQFGQAFGAGRDAAFFA